MAQDDKLAFESCFHDHYATVLAFALRRVGRRAAAEDLAAETFAVAWRRRERLPDPALPWLYSTASKLLANQRRSTRRREDVAQRLSSEAATAAPQGDPADALHDRTAFARAFRRLQRRRARALVADRLGRLGAARGRGRARLLLPGFPSAFPPSTPQAREKP